MVFGPSKLGKKHGAEGGFKIVDCRLQILDLGMRISDCGFGIKGLRNWRFQIEDLRLRIGESIEHRV